MSDFRRTAAFWGILLSLVWADAGTAQQAPSREGYRDRYGVLSERNIFLRDRGRRRRSEQPTSRPAYTPPAEEESFVLRGVVLEDGQFRAYVESLAGAAVLKLGVGEPVAGGKVTSIEMDGIEYEQTGHKSMRIEIGQTLSGGQAALSGPTTTGPAESTTQPSGAPIDPNKPMTIEEKMRLRRMQELNRK